MTPKEVDIKCKNLLDAIAYTHDGNECPEDLNGGWCAKCIHLEPEAVAFLRSVPRWQLIVAVTLDRLQTLFKLIKTYIPWRGRRHV